MREYLIIGTTLCVSYILSVTESQFLGFVWYDKLVHFSIGIFFAVNFFRILPEENPFKIATYFALLYEVFVYLIYGIPAQLIMMSTNNLNLWVIIEEFFLKYAEIDEWLDVIVAWMGVIFGPLLIRSEFDSEDIHA